MGDPQLPTFVQNVQAFVDALGVHNANIVLDLAQVPWTTSSQRDDFIDAFTVKRGA